MLCLMNNYNAISISHTIFLQKHIIYMKIKFNIKFSFLLSFSFDGLCPLSNNCISLTLEEMLCYQKAYIHNVLKSFVLILNILKETAHQRHEAKHGNKFWTVWPIVKSLFVSISHRAQPDIRLLCNVSKAMSFYSSHYWFQK